MRKLIRFDGRSWLRTVSCFGLLLSALLILGCGSGKVKIQGKVQAMGKPVPGGSLTFAPVAGTDSDAGKPFSATIGSDGTFTVVGTSETRHRVTYSAPTLETPEGLKPGQDGPRSPYQGFTPKQREVDLKAGENSIDIELMPPLKKKRR